MWTLLHLTLISTLTDMEKTIDNNRQACKSLCPITDVMAALGLGFDEQLGPNRHYILADTRTGKVYDFEVNIIRNEWISRKDNVQGGLKELIGWLPDVGLNNLDSYTNWGIPQVRRMYIELWHMQEQYPFTNLRYGKSAIASIGEIQDKDIIKNLAWHGISMTTALKAGCKEAVVFEHTKRKSSRMLAFPCEDGSYYLYNGACYRPINDGGISVVGKQHRDQFCYVYANWHDCLAMMERCHRNHIGMLCEGARHLVINGERNIDKAVTFLKENPDFREVRCLFPKDEAGERLFLKVAEETKGDATD